MFTGQDKGKWFQLNFHARPNSMVKIPKRGNLFMENKKTISQTIICLSVHMILSYLSHANRIFMMGRSCVGSWLVILGRIKQTWGNYKIGQYHRGSFCILPHLGLHRCATGSICARCVYSHLFGVCACVCVSSFFHCFLSIALIILTMQVKCNKFKLKACELI